MRMPDNGARVCDPPRGATLRVAVGQQLCELHAAEAASLPFDTSLSQGLSSTSPEKRAVNPTTRTVIMGKKDHLEIEEGKEVVRRTIVGGRPRARRKRKVRVPIGIEKVLYRAAADSTFRQSLFRDRDVALDEAGFHLLESELAILRSVPESVLATMIGKIDLKKHGKRKFMRAVGACALAATTAAAGAGCPVDDSGGPSSGDVVQDMIQNEPPVSRGITPDPVDAGDLAIDQHEDVMPAGILPDMDEDSGDAEDIAIDQEDLITAGIPPDLEEDSSDTDDIAIDQEDLITAGIPPDMRDVDTVETDVDIDVIDGITPDI